MESEKRSWADLQPELLSLILSRLIVVDSTTFRAVCRSWRSIIPADRHFFPFPFYESPALISLKGSLCKYYHPIYNEMYRFDLPELSGTRICASNFGWLLVNKGSKLFFFNPITDDKIDLPDIDLDNTVTKFHFSSPPTSPDCTVIGLTTSQNTAWVLIIKRGEHVWKLLSFHGGDKAFIKSCRCPSVFSNGKYYFMGETCNILVLNVEEGSMEILDWVYRKGYVVWPRSLMVEEKDGSPETLLVVFVSYEYRKVHVARFDFLKRVWEEVDSLASDKTLYLNDWGSYLETSVARGMGNKIYFPQFHLGSGVLYSLDTGKFHSSGGSYPSGLPADLRGSRSCTWIKPMCTKALVDELRWCDN